MNLLENVCDKILNLTKSNKYTMYIDKKLTNMVGVVVRLIDVFVVISF